MKYQIEQWATDHPRWTELEAMVAEVEQTHARQQNCYHFRSFSSGDKTANHQLKLSMGFAIQPTIRRDDNAGLYFIMPLQPSETKNIL